MISSPVRGDFTTGGVSGRVDAGLGATGAGAGAVVAGADARGGTGGLGCGVVPQPASNSAVAHSVIQLQRWRVGKIMISIAANVGGALGPDNARLLKLLVGA